MYSPPLFYIVMMALLLSSPITAQLSQLPKQNIASSNADAAWRPSPAQQEAVEEITMSYFSARDKNKFKQAYAFLGEAQKQLLPFTEYRQQLEEFNIMAGEVQNRQLRAVTWYKDTPHAGPGLYVAVDYSSSFSNLALHCGYVVWHQRPDGSFLQVREEMNVIDNETMAKLKPADFENIRAQFRC